jgi:hypothetical protein
MTVTFHNVTIALDAESPQIAYDELCALLDRYDRAHGGGAIEWETDTYSVDNSVPRDARELWPQPGDPRELATSDALPPPASHTACRQPQHARIVIFVDGGLVQNVLADQPDVEAMIVDYDNERRGDRTADRTFEPVAVDPGYIAATLQGTEE